MKDKIIQIRALISSRDIERLNDLERGELEYWDSGNMDDAFEIGCSVGFTQGLIKALRILEEWKE